LNILNVIIQTVKSICTIKCGKVQAAFVNALAYGLYTVVLVYMTCELTTITKAIVVAVCNLVGVYIVKLLEEKGRKDKLWKVEMTVNTDKSKSLADNLKKLEIPFSVLETMDGNYIIFNVYSATQKESILIKEIADRYKAKYFVSETKSL
jgi:uncharacterized protein YebE (UPF0316 family)